MESASNSPLIVRKKLLLTVKTYPLPSRSHDELVCTAAIDEEGNWFRIYPVPFQYLRANSDTFKKYQWFYLSLERRKDIDFRPESYSPVNRDFSDLKTEEIISTKNYWSERKKYVLQNVFTSKRELIEKSKSNDKKSLAVFKPKEIIEFVVAETSREWKKDWIEKRKQLDIFQNSKDDKELIIEKIPYKFSYRFIDEENKESNLMIEDWEIFQLYRNCLASSNGNEEVAIEMVRERYWNDFVFNKDIYLFLGTTKTYHAKNAPNPFVTIGVFYPPKTDQIELI